MDKPAVVCAPSPFALLLHCAGSGYSVNNWGSKRPVWVAFTYKGDMLTWNANKHGCRCTAEKTGKPFVLAKVQGIEEYRQ